jgi:Co/Zn/Cd efflux system component
MGAVAVLALIANVFVAAMLYRFREGDSNMASVGLARATTRSATSR